MPDRTAAPTPSFLPAPAAAPGSIGTLLGLSLRRPGGRRAVSLLTIVLLVSGVAMFSFPAVTDLFQRYQQRQVTLPDNPQYENLWKTHHVKVGQGLTRLVIDNDRVKVNVVVVQGTTPAAMRTRIVAAPASRTPAFLIRAGPARAAPRSAPRPPAGATEQRARGRASAR